MKNRALKMTLLLSTLFYLSAAQGKFSGYIYSDYYYNIARDTLFNPGNTSPSNAAISSSAPGGKTMQAFQLRRIYFAYDNTISETFSARLRFEADQSANTSNGKIGVFVKDAFLKWKNIFAGSDLIAGIQPTPAFEVSEAAWEYRSLEKTIMDLRGIVSSRDQGITLLGKLTDDGMLNYRVMIANNSGNSPESDKYKRYYIQLHAKPVELFQTTLYFDYKSAGDIKNSYNTAQSLTNSTSTVALFAGYAMPFEYSFGVEGFLASTSNGMKDTVAKSYLSKNTIGISIFGSLNILPELAAIARYDRYTPSIDSKGTDPAIVGASAFGNTNRDYIIIGAAYKADVNVSIIPNILYETYDVPKGAKSPEASLSARLTLYYIFL